MIWQYLLLFFFVGPTIAQVELPGPVDQIKWPTLSGKEPVVVARGGYSGVFPDSSEFALQFALDTTATPDGVVLYCDLQMTKDEVGICQPSLRLENTTAANLIFPHDEKTYDLYGDEIHGWFTLNYDMQTLIMNLTLMQNIYTRPNIFDGTMNIRTPEDIARIGPKNPFWLNIEYDMFYNEHKVSPARYIQESSKLWTPTYLSSPEIGFLKVMSRKINKKQQTKLIFKFKALDMVEPTTKETYHAILDKLPTIKSFASGILVPKNLIWPTNPSNYLLPKTTLVSDAHKQGLEVYVYGFVNDILLSYNYSFDPVKEYLNFVGSPDFAVDGVITDFPSTASSALACFAHKDLSKRKHPAVVITHNGASGDYPSNTDLAYQMAIDVGTDVIDCPVQMSKDGVPFCCGYPDLTHVANAFKTFPDRSRKIPEIQEENGIFTFDLTWNEIKTLKSVMKVISTDNNIVRNPLHKNKGNFLTLPEFLGFAGKKESLGIMIVIQYASYYASDLGFSIVDIVTDALKNSTFNKDTDRRVMILADESSVLPKFKDFPKYEKILGIVDIGDAPKDMVDELKKHADGVFISKTAIAVQDTGSFILHMSNVTMQLRAANISVYAGIFLNEYIYLVFDYCADPYIELATLMPFVDGVMTDFPATAISYLLSPCSMVDDPQKNRVMYPYRPGMLAELGMPELVPAVGPPLPPLTVMEMVDPPLPPVAAKTKSPNSSSSSSSAAPHPKGPKEASDSTKTAANVVGISIISFLLLSFLSIR